jgi:hypothetical protein
MGFKLVYILYLFGGEQQTGEKYEADHGLQIVDTDRFTGRSDVGFVRGGG